MLLYYVPLVNISAYSLNDIAGNSSQTGILVTVGLLLFVFGTMLRRGLPLPEDTTSSHPNDPSLDPKPLTTYMGSKPVAASVAASARHASAV